MSADEVFTMAVAAGCQPVWYDGICGPAWHCDWKKKQKEIK